MEGRSETVDTVVVEESNREECIWEAVRNSTSCLKHKDEGEKIVEEHLEDDYTFYLVTGRYEYSSYARINVCDSGRGEVLWLDTIQTPKNPDSDDLRRLFENLMNRANEEYEGVFLYGESHITSFDLSEELELEKTPEEIYHLEEHDLKLEKKGSKDLHFEYTSPGSTDSIIGRWS